MKHLLESKKGLFLSLAVALTSIAAAATTLPARAVPVERAKVCGCVAIDPVTHQCLGWDDLGCWSSHIETCLAPCGGGKLQ